MTEAENTVNINLMKLKEEARAMPYVGEDGQSLHGLREPLEDMRDILDRMINAIKSEV